MSELEGLFDRSADWQKRLASVLEIARAMILQTDPQKMVQDYGRCGRCTRPTAGFPPAGAG